ncbi:transcription factor bHLH47 isoform X2 [Ricinus communis]|nr:transcription factor bHLH47 isoform X2 [Ricinus communis]|eukprot:XP_015578579.1 transcription factor bHLH47 isoform X2 [Ricinus communis]
MASDISPSASDDVNVTVEPTKRSCPGKNKGKVPKRIHKAEREKLKREQLNDLFLDLADALDLTQPNNGKASILCEAARLLKDLFGQIECLKKENESLLSESRYVTVEKNELREENLALETQIESLQGELEAKAVQSKPDLNMPPPELHHPELAPHFTGESLGLPVADGIPQQAPAVFVVPLHPSLQAYPRTTTNVSKPHARYATPADSWPSQLLEEQLTIRKEVQ